MNETRVRFAPRDIPGVLLDGVLIDGGGPGCPVSHPHPLHGGHMDHPVVVALHRALGEAGFRALRYDFRGVRASGGTLGPKDPLPVGDLWGAIDFLGGGPMPAVGYSFGARTTLHAIAAGAPISRAALVGFPTRLPANPAAMSNLILGRRVRGEAFRAARDLHTLANAPCPVLVVAGDKDPLVEAEVLRARGVDPVLIPGVNHFFSRRLGNQPPEREDLDRLCASVVDFLGV